MELLADALDYCAIFIRNHLNQICFGITAVTIMLFGPNINGTTRHLTRKLNWILRYGVFVILCTVGYTFLSQAIFQGTRRLLLSCSSPLLVAATAGIYLVLAWIAKEQKAI